MVKIMQGIRSTGKFHLGPPENPATVPEKEQAEKPTKESGSQPNELHIHAMITSKLYMNETGRSPVRLGSGNQYIMVAYHSSNVILVAPFKTRMNKHRIAACNSIMQRLQDRSLKTDLQILDSETSQDYKATIKDKWGVDFQLVSPDIHIRNAAELEIHTLKAHFLAILSGVAPEFPQFLWDLLLLQPEMTLNFPVNQLSTGRFPLGNTSLDRSTMTLLHYVLCR